jgi:ABC-2 type transport system permease protein
MSGRALTSFEAVGVTAGREIRERVRTKGVRWATVVLVVIAVGLALVPRLLPDIDDPEWTVAVAGAAPAGLDEAVAAISAVETATVVVERTDDDPEAVVRGDDIDAVVVDGEVVIVEGAMPDRLRTILTAALHQAHVVEDLAGLGVPPQQAQQLLAPPPLEVRSLDGDDDDFARQQVAFLGTLVLFFAIMTYGGWVLNSVLEEKSNRVVEIVVSAIRPWELLAAKVLGAGAVGLAQLLLVVVVGVAAAVAAGTLPDMPDFVATTVFASLGWFVLGFVFYAVGYAAAGSLTTRQEDASSVSTPLIALAMVAYFASVFVVNPNPDSTAARAVSFIPPITPWAMPTRMAHGTVAGWEVAAAVALMVAATAVMILLAGRIYANALLNPSGRVKALTALRTTGR